jgi:hypothetical protein
LNRLIMVACALLALFAASRVYTKMTKEDPRAQLAQVATRLRASLPRKLNDQITMTDVQLEGNTLRFVADIDPALSFHPERLDADKRALVLKSMCNETTRTFFKQNFSAQARYNYRENGAAKTWDLTITPSDCV